LLSKFKTARILRREVNEAKLLGAAKMVKIIPWLLSANDVQAKR